MSMTTITYGVGRGGMPLAAAPLGCLRRHLGAELREHTYRTLGGHHEHLPGAAGRHQDLR